MEVPGVALGLLHFTINGGSLWGKPCFSITPTHTLTHPATNLQVEAELCLFVQPGVTQDAGLQVSPVGMLIRVRSYQRRAGDGGAEMRGGEGGRREAPSLQNSQVIRSQL